MDGGWASIRILLADAQCLFRDVMKTGLESQADMRVVGLSRTGVEAVADAERLRPEIALIDAHIPNGDGIRATERIAETVPDCRVLLVGNEEDQGVLERAVEAGAAGYVTKDVPLPQLVEAIRAVHRGEMLIPGRMLAVLLRSMVRRRRSHDVAMRQIQRLTVREREVLTLLANGADNGVIAQALVISPQTARTHIQNLIEKLGVHSRVEAVAFVNHHGVLDELLAAEAS